jgi:hypothetical protein
MKPATQIVRANSKQPTAYHVGRGEVVLKALVLIVFLLSPESGCAVIGTETAPF